MESRPPQSQPDPRSAMIAILRNALCKVGDLNWLLALKQLRRQTKPMPFLFFFFFFSFRTHRSGCKLTPMPSEAWRDLFKKPTPVKKPLTQTCVTLIKSAECNQTAGSSSPSAAGSPVSARLFKEKGERVKKEKKKKEKKKMKKEQRGKCIMNLKSVFQGGWK